MAIEITDVRLSGGSQHEHITHVRWRGIETGKSDSSTVATVVDWINDDGTAWVGTGADRIRVRVVRPVSGLRYLRTYADGLWTNNLLSLPRF